jgi:hypothetical protein
MTLSLLPPRGARMLPAEQMNRDARAQACWLAIQAGLRVDPETWAYDADSKVVIVDVPDRGRTWGRVRIPAADMAGEIERHFGAEARERTEREL